MQGVASGLFDEVAPSSFDFILDTGYSLAVNTCGKYYKYSIPAGGRSLVLVQEPKHMRVEKGVRTGLHFCCTHDHCRRGGELQTDGPARVDSCSLA